MWGYVLGGASLLGLMAMGRHRHHRWGHHGYRRHCGGGYRGGGSRHWGPRGALRWLFERLDTSPGQERVILEAAETLKNETRDVRSEWRKSREDLAKAIRENAVGSPALQEAFGRHEGVLKKFKDAAVAQLQHVVEVLDERQREVLADILERFGSYRSEHPHFI